MDLNRRVAYNTLIAVEKENAFSNIELNKQINNHEPSSPAFVRELVYGVLEKKIYLDYILERYFPKGIKSVKKQDLMLLRMAIYQMEFMDTVPEYAAINETVTMAKKLCRGRDGFINGVLRSYSKTKKPIELPHPKDDIFRYFSIRYSISMSIIELWAKQMSIEELELLLEGLEKKSKVTARINLLKTTKEEIVPMLKKYDIIAKENQVLNSMTLAGKDILKSKPYQEGYFSIQDKASLMAAQALEAAEGEVLIDMCAAPGGKTLALAEMMSNKGKIYALDMYEHKLEIINKQAQRLGITIVTTAISDGQILNKEFINTADKVLCDVPCSGLGVIEKKPEIRYKKIEEDFADLRVKQRLILNNAAKYVKPDGILVYSTCTINKYENQDIIKEFLNSNDEYEIVYQNQYLPHIDNTDGFFVCKLHKKNRR